MNPTDVADRLAVGGTAGLIAGLVFALFAVIIGFQTKWIIQGWLYKETKAECKSWQVLAEGMEDKLDRVLTLMGNQQSQVDRMSERGERTERIAQENSTKLDKLIMLVEAQAQRRTTR